MGRINTGRLGLKSDKHRGPTALGVYFIKPRPTGVYSTHLKPPRNDLFLKSTLAGFLKVTRVNTHKHPLKTENSQ